MILAADLAQRWPSVPFALIALLGLMGALRAEPKRPVEWFIIAAMALFLWSGLVLYVTSRLRMIVVPLLAVLGGGGIVRLLERARAGRRRFLIVTAACSGLFLALSLSTDLTIQYERDLQRPAFTQLMTGIALKASGRLAESLTALEAAQRLTPGCRPEAAALIAEIKRELQVPERENQAAENLIDTERRIQEVTAALLRYPADRNFLNLLTDLLWKVGRRREAVAQIEQAVDLHPQDPQARFKLACMLAAVDGPASCERQVQLYREALALGLRLERAAPAQGVSKLVSGREHAQHIV